MRRATYGAGFMIVLVSLATSVMASTPQAAPEIDGASMATGLALLAGGVLMVRARLRGR